jgi:UDP-glucose 4-epimerase
MSASVAVTGADGFIGSHLVEALVARGDRVRAMVQYNSFGSWGWLDSVGDDVRDRIDVVAGDVRDADSVADLLHGVEMVYHLAALIAIPYSYRAPASYVHTNVLGTLNVLTAARRHDLSRVVHTSTSEVYGTARYAPIPETHPLQAQSPYSASKIAADKLAESFHLSYRTPVVTLRPFNTFGPRQSARAVIPTIISQIASGERTIRLGSLDPIRDFTFVTDTASAFIAVGTAPEATVIGKTVNAGSGSEVSVKDLVLTIAEVMDADITVELDPQRLRPDGSEVLRLLADTTLIRSLTSWRPEYDLAAGLRATARWFTEPANLARYKPALYTT